jgi:hypothetical protein
MSIVFNIALVILVLVIIAISALIAVGIRIAYRNSKCEQSGHTRDGGCFYCDYTGDGVARWTEIPAQPRRIVRTIR